MEGIGIHTGTPSRVTLSPAPNGAGIVFRSRGVEIPAHVDNVIDTSRCTVLGKNGVTVSTVEHLMSMLTVKASDSNLVDVYIDVEGSELPIGDGSSLLWTNALPYDYVSDTRENTDLESPLLVTGKQGSFISAYPSGYLKITVAAVFEHPLVGTQVARWDDSDSYRNEIAPARTFGFIEEVEALRKAGLALGGSEENAVVVYPDRYSSPLRFPNELARHKLLDLMGDLALAGLPLPNMEVFAVKPSHRLNVEFARALVTSLAR